MSSLVVDVTMVVLLVCTADRDVMAADADAAEPVRALISHFPIH